MKNIKMLFSLLLLVHMTLPIYGQSNLLVDSLEQILFPNNDSDEIDVVLLEFEYAKERYVLRGRKTQPVVSDIEKIEKLLFEIRASKDTGIMERLIEVQRRFEDYFLNEWEPAYRIVHPKYVFCYKVLMNMEMTLASLYMDTFDSSQKKYKYLKNIYMSQWGDGAEERKKRIRFFSSYIKNKWNGGCLGGSFCAPALIIEMANDLEEGIINDLRSFVLDSLSEDEKQFYLVTLGKAVRNMKSNEIEEIFINRIDDIDRLSPNYEFYLENQIIGRNPRIYFAIGERGRAKGLEFLLNEFDSEDLLKPGRGKLHSLCFTDTGKELMEKRLLQEIRNSKGKRQKEYISMLIGWVYYPQRNIEKINQLSGVIDSENKAVLNDFIERINNKKKATISNEHFPNDH